MSGQHTKLRKRIIDHFHLTSPISNGFPIPIDRVCDPILQGCFCYSEAKLGEAEIYAPFI